MSGVVVLVVALVAALVLAVLYRRTNGAFRDASSTADVETVERTRETSEVLTAGDLGADLGPRATLLQFSSAFCAPCRATRRILTDVAAVTPGVTHVELDAESHLDLVRRLDVLRTPTVLVLDARGVVTRRASGLPRQDQVLTALADAIDA